MEDEEKRYMLVVKPNMVGAYPLACSMIGDSIRLWAFMMGSCPISSVYIIYQQEPYDLFLTLLKSFKDSSGKTVATENGQYHFLGPIPRRLEQTIVEEIGYGFEDAWMIPRKRQLGGLS
jgi:hypothetical protein